LLDRLVKENYQVSLETSGSIDIADINPGVSIVMDVKTITLKGILSIAITTSEWTACEAHKHGRQTHFSRFAL
jgi:hypothetical protein